MCGFMLSFIKSNNDFLLDDGSGSYDWTHEGKFKVILPSVFGFQKKARTFSFQKNLWKSTKVIFNEKKIEIKIGHDKRHRK